ncbi:MAG: 50S ribosomal protein L24 [Clostridia bacterium]|nr:50S ribosomal protein L24 [Clostridia bacterium]
MIKKIKNESKIKLRAGDTVIVNSGTEKGKKGKIIKVLKADNKVVVQGINVRTRHVKPRKQGQESGILKIEAPVNVSKVNYFCEKCSKGVKVGVEVSADGKRTRVCRKCHTEIK